MKKEKYYTVKEVKAHGEKFIREGLKYLDKNLKVQK